MSGTSDTQDSRRGLVIIVVLTRLALTDFSQGAAPEDVVGPGRCVGGIMGIDAKAPDGQGGESPIAILGSECCAYLSVI